jgi:four helix bundle protein
MRNYNNYKVWNKSHELVQFVYTKVLPSLPFNEQHDLARQMKRAAYSVPFNIVEGSARDTDKDFAHFLDQSLGSIMELEYCSRLLRDLNFIEAELYDLLNPKINDVKAMMIRLIKTIRGKNRKA